MYTTSIIVFHLFIPACNSLKRKRGHLKPLLHAIKKKFNVSVSEIEKLDNWNETVIACAHVSNNMAFARTYMNKIEYFILNEFQNFQLLDSKIEIIT